MADADTEDRILAHDAALLTEAVREAGALAQSLFRTELKNWTKGASSPVSEADIAVNDLLEARLRTAAPDYGWLSEESVDDDARLGKRLVWIVDPIDGTRAGLCAGQRRILLRRARAGCDAQRSAAAGDRGHRAGFCPHGRPKAAGAAIERVTRRHHLASANRILGAAAMPGRGRQSRCRFCGRPEPGLGPCGGEFDRAGSGW